MKNQNAGGGCLVNSVHIKFNVQSCVSIRNGVVLHQ